MFCKVKKQKNNFPLQNNQTKHHEYIFEDIKNWKHKTSTKINGFGIK